eukprot:SAG22_NODE_135_length_18211_cov_560.916519_7_plen_242_part_00
MSRTVPLDTSSPYALPVSPPDWCLGFASWEQNTQAELGSPRQIAAAELEVERLRQGLETKTAELRQLANTKDLLDRDLTDLQKQQKLQAEQFQQQLAAARGGGAQDGGGAPSGGGSDGARMQQLEKMLGEQTAAHAEEKQRLRELIDVNTKDLAELSAEWGLRNQQQEEKNMELLSQAETAGKVRPGGAPSAGSCTVVGHRNAIERDTALLFAHNNCCWTERTLVCHPSSTTGRPAAEGPA